MKNRLQTEKYNVKDARVHIIDNNGNVSNNTHGIIYIAEKTDRRQPNVVVYLEDGKIGYTKITDSYLTENYNDKNDVWRDMVAKRLLSYSKGTGNTDFWKIFDILVVPRGGVGEPISPTTIIDTYIHKLLDNKSATMLGNDLLNFGFENNLNEIDLKDRGVFFNYVTSEVKKLYNFEPNEIELDCAQELEMAEWFYQFESFLKSRTRMGATVVFKSHLNLPMRFGKSLYSIKKMIELQKKYGFKTVLMFAWVLNANNSFMKEKNQWKEFANDTVNFMDKKQTIFSTSKLNWVDISLHYSLKDFKKTYGFLKNAPGPIIALGDEFDDGAWNKTSKEKIDWMLTHGKNYA